MDKIPERHNLMKLTQEEREYWNRCVKNIETSYKFLNPQRKSLAHKAFLINSTNI